MTLMVIVESAWHGSTAFR